MQKISKQKRIQIQKLLAISLSFFSLLFFCNSCYEPIEGCLDINSSNYEVSADRACDSCCVFPNFNVNIDQVFLGEDFSFGDTLTNSLGEIFTITDYDLIFSDFNLESNGAQFTVTDTTVVSCNGNLNNYEKNDLINLRSTSSFVTIGEWRFAEDINSISFILGLNDCYHDAGIDNLDDDSRISSIDTLYQSGTGFRTLLLEINDSLRYELVGGDESISISQPISSSNAAGSALVMNMNIDFGIWLADFRVSDDLETTKSKLIQNANAAIRMTE